jgi:hypothetical protein
MGGVTHAAGVHAGFVDYTHCFFFGWVLFCVKDRESLMGDALWVLCSLDADGWQAPFYSSPVVNFFKVTNILILLLINKIPIYHLFLLLHYALNASS